MSMDSMELVIEYPTAATMRDLARIVSGRSVELESVLLSGDATTLREILVRCSDGDVRLSDEQTQSNTPADGIRFSVAPGSIADSDATGSPARTASPRVANGGQTVAPQLAGDTLPDPDGLSETDERVAETAERFGLDSDSLLEIAAAVNEEERAAQIRHLLELAFRHHLDRPNKGGRGYVEIRMSASPSVGRYHYLDNGRGRGGAHYFRGLTPSMRESVRRIAIEQNLSVLAEGDAHISVSFERVDIGADVRFVELILSSVFEKTLADIVAIEEFVGREIACSWIT